MVRVLLPHLYPRGDRRVQRHRGLCHTKSALAQACCVECTVWSMVAGTFLSGCLCPCICCVPCVYTAYFTMVRDAFKRKYGLPDDEFFGGHLTWSSYLACGTPAGALGGLCCWWPQLFCSWPCIHGFTACASFQNGHFFKHASPIKRDYECCLYKHVGIAIFGTGQMPQPSAPRGAPPAADSCHYE